MLDFQKIRELRKSLGMNQEQAAKKSGLGSKARWSHVEKGASVNITIELLERIATTLGVKGIDLLNDIPSPRRKNTGRHRRRKGTKK